MDCNQPPYNVGDESFADGTPIEHLVSLAPGICFLASATTGGILLANDIAERIPGAYGLSAALPDGQAWFSSGIPHKKNHRTTVVNGTYAFERIKAKKPVPTVRLDQGDGQHIVVVDGPVDATPLVGPKG